MKKHLTEKLNKANDETLKKIIVICCDDVNDPKNQLKKIRDTMADYLTILEGLISEGGKNGS